MGYIANLKRNYIEIMKNDGVQNAIAAVIENAIAALEDEVWNEVCGRDNIDLYNEWVDSICGDYVYRMDDLDDVLGQMYPTDWENWKDESFTMCDGFFCMDGTSGDISDYTDSNEIATSIYNGDVYRETTSEMDEIVEEAHEMIEYLQEEANKVNRAKQIFDNLVTYENADILVNAIWGAMQEQ